MKLRTLASLVVFSLSVYANNVEVSAQSKSLYGTYQNCPFACEAVQINPDFTFVHRLDGDLFNDIRSRGNWKFVGKDKIRVVSASANAELQVVEATAGRSGSFRIVLIDAVGGLIPGAKVSGSVNGIHFERESNERGVVEIPECEEFNIALGGSRGYRGTHKIENPGATEFTVTLTIEQMLETRIDEIWLVQNGCLYFVESDGSHNKDYCLKKVSRRKAAAIFGTAMPNKRFQWTRR